MTSAGDGQVIPPRIRPLAKRRWSALPTLLAVLALWDLRHDILLLLDRPTITAGLYLIRSHPLAVLVLLLQPSLWRRYRGG
jgi:hypothetical protein